MKTGAPSTYKSEYCERVIELGNEGASLTAMAVAIGVARKTVYEWAEKYPQFGDALARARELSLLWWEREGNKGMWAGKIFNAHVWNKMVSCRFPDDYRDKTGIELTGANGGPVKIDDAIAASKLVALLGAIERRAQAEGRDLV